MSTVSVLRVGLTGGIASGKTTVAELFAARGVPVIDTDEISREVVAPGEPALKRIVLEFGSEILAHDGSLDRRRLRELVFSDPVQRQRLEAILHPIIREQLRRLSLQAGGPYQVHVIPLLIEGGLEDEVDRVLVVDAPLERQIERLLERDAESEKQARAMISAQAGRKSRLAHADDLITNEGTLADLEAQVERLHRRYLRLTDERQAQ
jgi:dephospho-CoA kinase